jgi:hypothetical protein
MTALGRGFFPKSFLWVMVLKNNCRLMGYSPQPNLLRTLLAPLFVLSVGLHMVLLVVPLPSRPETSEAADETEIVEEEETVVDLLSISSLATAEPELPVEPPPAEAPPPEAAPKPVASQAPTQPVVPETFPADPPPEPPPEEPPPDDFSQEEFLEPEPEPPALGFDPNRQAELAGNVVNSIGRAPGESDFDLTDQFTGANLDLPDNRPLWPAEKRQCFFNSVNANGFTPASGALDIRFLSRNVDLIRQNDIPRTFAQQTVNPLGPVYCNEALFEVLDVNGTPILWVSLVPVSPGGSSALVVIWQQDPRAG